MADNTDNVPIASSSNINVPASDLNSRNSTGKNQYTTCRKLGETAGVHWDILNIVSAPAGDDRVKNLLIGYHRRGITSRKVISQLLLAEPEPIIMRYCCSFVSFCNTVNIFLSEGTVARRLKTYHLFASGKTTRLMPETEKRQHVLDQMSLDPTSKQGPRTIKEGLASKVHLTRYMGSKRPKFR